MTLIGKDVAEKEFLDDIASRWELREPGQGKSDAFVKQWYDDRKKRYEPAFIKSFKRYAIVDDLPDTEAKYTLIVKTKHTEPGWSVGVAGGVGVIDGELWIVESADHSNVIAKLIFEHMKGDYDEGGDFDMTIRIAPAYAFAGRMLGDAIRKRSK